MHKQWQDILKFLNEPKWPNRITFYILFFACVSLAFILPIILMSTFFPGYSILHNGMNHDNARYMLSALIQSLAAVVAIVVTLSLVAIQLSAQSYSSRVIDVYRKTPDIWILISIYTTNIFFGLATIKIIGTNTLPPNGLFSLEFFIFIAYFMGFFAFICLIPYIWNTLALVNPSTVVQLLTKDITEQKILKIVDKRETTLDENDPLLPIIDIITGSMMKYDYATVRTGANAIVNLASKILSEEHEKEITEHVSTHLKRVSMLALKRDDEESFEIVMDSFTKIANNTVKNGLEETTKSLVGMLRQIGELALADQNYLVIFLVDTLEKLGVKTGEKEQKSATSSVISALNTFSQYGSFKGVDSSIIRALDKVSQNAIDNKWCMETEEIIRALTHIEEKAIQNKSEWDIESIIYVSVKIGERSIQNDCKNSANFALLLLEKIGREIVQNGWDDTTGNVVDALSRIGKKAVENGWYDITEKTDRAVATIKQKQNELDDKQSKSA